MTPYYQDDHVTLFCGDMRDVVPTLGQFDAIVTDPPYGETNLVWDRWQEGWPSLLMPVTHSMWCFGSLRMFVTRWAEFADWKLSQDVVWEKGAGAGIATDRFRRVHEYALHWYQGSWARVYHRVPRVSATREQIARNGGIGKRLQRNPDGLAHLGEGRRDTHWVEDGTRMIRSVIHSKSMRGRALHPTEKPTTILAPLIEYATPTGGVILDPFAGSCSTLATARMLGRRAVGIEVDEAMCEKAVRMRLDVPDLFGGVA